MCEWLIFLPINNFYRVFFSRFVFTHKVTSLFKNTLQRKSENLFIYNGKTLDDKSSACECFVQKKYFSSERFFLRKNSHYRIMFPEADPGTLQNMKWSTFQKHLIDCKSYLLSQRTPSYIWNRDEMEMEIIKLWKWR